jgi:hypothetical protein
VKRAVNAMYSRRTAVSGSYVTAECTAYSVKGEGPLLMSVECCFRCLLGRSDRCPFKSIRTGARWARHAIKENA